MKYNELNSGQAVRMVEQVLEVWKTIKLGTDLKTIGDFCQRIRSVGGKVSDWAKDIMRKLDFVKSVSQGSVEVDLCVATTEEILGEKGKSGTLSEIYASITGRMGGEILPAEAGPQLRSQYTDQPNDESLFIAMEPIKDFGGNLSIFYVYHAYGDFWLHTSYTNPGHVYDSGSRWVFARPRRK